MTKLVVRFRERKKNKYIEPVPDTPLTVDIVRGAHPFKRKYVGTCSFYLHVHRSSGRRGHINNNITGMCTDTLRYSAIYYYYLSTCDEMHEPFPVIIFSVSNGHFARQENDRDTYPVF